jgi:hypothetical protein
VYGLWAATMTIVRTICDASLSPSIPILKSSLQPLKVRIGSLPTHQSLPLGYRRRNLQAGRHGTIDRIYGRRHPHASLSSTVEVSHAERGEGEQMSTAGPDSR